jgi:hypothetical protein
MAVERFQEEGRWSAEVAIPLSILFKDGKVGNIRFNIARTKLIPELDGQGVRVGEKREASTLYPVKQSFHETASFGELKGLAVAQLEEACG